jgi:hypothetical protein
MSLVGVYILTTGGPVRIETIHARQRPPRSEITVGQDYSQRLPATKDYDLFVSNAGPVGQALAHFGDSCYRLQVSSAFDDGNSWELACFIAHALDHHGRFASDDEAADEIIMASGRVDLAFDVGAVEHVKRKLEAARETIETWRAKGVAVKILLPHQDGDVDGLVAPEGAELCLCRSVADAVTLADLPWTAPKPPRGHKLAGLVRPKNRRLVLAFSLAAVAALVLAVSLFGRERLGIPYGPIQFDLSSDKGAEPVYRIGDKLNLELRTDRDAWIYCYYTQSDGKTMAILPNPEFWKDSFEPHFSAGVMYRMPGDDTYPFELIVSEPTGEEFIKCFAVSRDVTWELPEALRGESWGPIMPSLVKKISEVFRNLPETAISEANLKLKILPSSSD